MSTIYVNKIIEADFETIQDLQDLFFKHAYNGLALGVKWEKKSATVQQKRLFKGVAGWRVSYGQDLKRGYISESKATTPNNFITELLCSANYTVEIL